MAPALHEIQSKLSCLSQETVNSLEVGSSHQGSKSKFEAFVLCKQCRACCCQCSREDGQFLLVWGFFPMQLHFIQAVKVVVRSYCVLMVYPRRRFLLLCIMSKVADGIKRWSSQSWKNIREVRRDDTREEEQLWRYCEQDSIPPFVLETHICPHLQKHENSQSSSLPLANSWVRSCLEKLFSGVYQE